MSQQCVFVERRPILSCVALDRALSTVWELIFLLCPSLEDAQNQMDTILSNLLSQTCLWAEIWTRWSSQVPSCLSWSVILNKKEAENKAFGTTINKYFSANVCCYCSIKEHWCVNTIQWNTQICVTVSTMTQ